ncbi:hypothetical protein B0A49_10577 [Cryomyces minteri]|uniref:Major facilitator superfamily (MFS) profile domain-containing protein n=1 Tax=Cryomyces minteri TaxID=331657 RepID=A0A4U0W5C7_9PEZI|nr:hypothetical protein B0A49_10577 [Cryomyces minteri]
MAVKARPTTIANSDQDERSPLLRSPPPSIDEIADTNATAKTESTEQQWRYQTVVLLMILTVLILGCGDEMIQSPQTRIFESIFCRQYYDSHSSFPSASTDRGPVERDGQGWPLERFCKIEPVQSDVAMLKGWQTFLECIPSVLLAVPFGWLADRYGRKWILVIGVGSFFVRAAWIQVVSSAFLWLGAASITTGFIAPPISAVMMNYTPWLPMLLGLTLHIPPIFIQLAIPETLNYRSSSTLVALEPGSSSPTSTAKPASNVLTRLLHRVWTATAFLFSDWRIPALITTFLGHMFMMSAGPLLLQYISKRYDWTISQATYLISLRAGMNALVLFLLLPSISSFLQRRCHFTGQQKDLYHARLSAALLALGFSGLALAPTATLAAVGLILTSLGSGAMFMIRSFMTSLVESHHVARLYTVVSAVDTLGLMAGGPLAAGLFRAGLKVGGAWVGLPFAVLAGLFAGVALLLCFVRIRKGGEAVVKDGDTADGVLVPPRVSAGRTERQSV